MKKIFCVLFAAMTLFSVSFLVYAEQNNEGSKVIAYYFHGDFRCSTCTTMEQYSKDAIEGNFKDAIASGKLEFKTINVDKAGNEHFTQHYQLYTKSLIVSLVTDGKEMQYKNLTKIWEYVRNKEKFFDYVIEEVNNFLREEQ